MMTILHLSDTHGFHHQVKNLPKADIIVHCGDFSNYGTEKEVLDFLNWYIELPYQHKIFVAGNHDLCLWDAGDIEDLPENVHFLQDRSATIEGVKFFGLAYNHHENMIPDDADIVVTHEPPLMILDEEAETHWGNILLRNRLLEVKPKYHLFGHAHKSYGIVKQEGIVYSNASLLNEYNQLANKPRLFILTAF